MSNDFRLLMLGAMYENGGNTTHRFLDGHPSCSSIPSSRRSAPARQRSSGLYVPVKYRWPVFPLEGTPAKDYEPSSTRSARSARARRSVSKFRHMPFDFSDDERERLYGDT